MIGINPLRGKSMKKSLSILIVLVVLAVGVYYAIGLFNVKPPTPSITVEEKKVESVQGSYCWEALLRGVCADMISPPELIEFQELKPVVVSPQSRLKIEFKKEPKENTLIVNRWLTNGEIENVPISDNVVLLPNEKGIYVYDVSARWDNGSSSYAFVIEVK